MFKAAVSIFAVNRQIFNLGKLNRARCAPSLESMRKNENVYILTKESVTGGISPRLVDYIKYCEVQGTFVFYDFKVIILVF